MFGKEADPLNCFVDIQAGAGGTEACDWAGMLRQYLKYAERKGFKATVEEETPGDIAGIKSATIHIEGEYAYGLRTEPACTAWCASRPSTRAAATPALPAVHLSRDRRLIQIEINLGRAHRHLPRIGRRRPAHQQDRLAGA